MSSAVSVCFCYAVTKDDCFLYCVPQPVHDKESELGHKETLSRDKDIQQKKKEEKDCLPRKKINK